jgi:O-antigen ligase
VNSFNPLAQKSNFGVVAVVAIVAALAGAFSPIEYLPIFWGAVAVATIIVLWANFGDLMSLILLWFVSVACFSYFFWRETIPIPGIVGFNITIDRLLILLILFVAGFAWIIGRMPIKPAPNVVRMMLLLLAYFTVSLVYTGFTSIAEVSPHFRLAGGYYFPAIALMLTYFAVNDEPQIKKICWFFLFFGLYLTLTAWAEHFKLWSIVFPRYIAEPEYGIHWGRARGPFLVSASLGITLVFCFFNNLFLASRTNGPIKALIHVANLLMLPAIFFTQTRSVWLAMVVCAFLWIGLIRRIRSRVAIVMMLLASLVVGGAIFWSDILSRDRTQGGVTDPYPVFARFGLAKITWQMFCDHPITGVGFGHFRDYAASFPQDPTSKYIRFGSRLMEHNNFLSILAEGGIIGLAIYLLVLLAIFRHSLRLYRRIPLEASGWVSRDLVILYWVLLVDYLIDGMFRETSVDPFNNGLFFAFTGLILAVDYLLDYRSEPAKAMFPPRIH